MTKLKAIGEILAIMAFGASIGITFGAALCGAQNLGDIVRMVIGR